MNKRRSLALILWLGLFAILLPFVMEFFVRQMLYPAPAFPVPSAPKPLEELTLESSEGDRIVAWLSHGEDEGPAVLFLHGNGENLETLRLSGLFERFRSLGASVLAIDFPGYGRSTGTPSEAALIASGRASFEALAERFPDRPKFIVGWSLGAAVAVQTAAGYQERLAGQVFLSPWHDLPTVASRVFPRWLVRIVLRDRYHSGEAAADLVLPTLVLHGENDDLIPADQGRRLAELLPGGSRFVGFEGVGHDVMAREEAWRHLAEYLTAASGSRARHPTTPAVSAAPSP